MTTPIDMTWLQTNFPELSAFRPLGQGGQKLVLAAKHKRDGDVVLKIVYPRTDPESVRREILAVQQVQSPRVPRILDQGVANTNVGACVWLREEQVPGSTLRKVLDNGPLPAESVLRLGLHMMEVLEGGERAQIVHRDVKPDNIICDLAGNFWLLDFGIARHLDLSSLTATALPFDKMTLGYAPPEQCRNFLTDIDSRADLSSHWASHCMNAHLVEMRSSILRHVTIWSCSGRWNSLSFPHKSTDCRKGQFS